MYECQKSRHLDIIAVLQRSDKKKAKHIYKHTNVHPRDGSSAKHVFTKTSGKGSADHYTYAWVLTNPLTLFSA